MTASSSTAGSGVRQAAPGQASAPPVAGGVAAALNAASAHLRDRNVAAARGIVDSLLAGHGGNASVLGFAGLLAMEEGRPDEAVVWFTRAAERRPDLPEIWHNLATALDEAGKRTEAVAAYEKVLAIRPDHLPALLQFAVLLRAEGRFAEALTLHDRAVALAPRKPEAHAWRAATRQWMGDAAGAVRDYRRALRLAPDDVESRMSLATVLLAQGRFEEGLAHYECRLPRFLDSDPALDPRWLPWQGEPLERRRLVVVAEQGLGDNIQFARYLALLRRREPEAGIIYWCPVPLLRLMERFAARWNIELVAWRNGDIPPRPVTADLYVGLLSLPYLFETRVETIPGLPEGYLAVAEGETAAWRERLAGLAGRKIGLCWRGSTALSYTRQRNISLPVLEPLLAVPGVSWVGLQLAPEMGDLHGTPWKGRMCDVSAELRDLADTAALVRSLDLVITVDSAVAHVAGAAGTPVWLLHRLAGCWRWLAERGDSPWYPAMRIFRQERFGEWGDTVGGVVAELNSFGCD